MDRYVAELKLKSYAKRSIQSYQRAVRQLQNFCCKGLDEATEDDLRAYIRKYRWSSYPAYIGRVKPEDFVDYSLCWDMVDAAGRQHTKSYRRFVEDGLDRQDEELEEARSWSPVAIVSEVFVHTIEAMHDIKSREANKPENVLNRQTRPLFDPTVLLSVAADLFDVSPEDLLRHRKNDSIKPVLARLLTHYAGLSQRDTATYLDLSTGAAVCLQLKKFQQDSAGQMKKDLDKIVRIFNF